MAGSSFFALLDDIATVMDDVAILSKVAAKKTSGVLGDDLALNAQQVSGLTSNRELPVVIQVAKGSLVNKCIIVPSILLISAVTPWMIIPLLMAGGLYLCYEGAEKVLHSFTVSPEEVKRHHIEHLKHLTLSDDELVKLEKAKIKGAVRTDFILSAEIMVISLGVVANFPFLTRSLVLVAIAILMTIGVYGLVALIIKIDDLGNYLLLKGKAVSFGKFLLLAAPYLMKFLSIAGTIAMFLVGGGIIVHGFAVLHYFFDSFISLNTIGRDLLVILYEGIVGFIAGLLVCGVVLIVNYIKKNRLIP